MSEKKPFLKVEEGEEEKEELDVPNKAYDFGTIETSPTTDTIPLVMTEEAQEQEDEEEGLLGSGIPLSSPEDDVISTAGSWNTEAENEKRQQQRKVALILVGAGLFGIVLGFVLLMVGLFRDDSDPSRGVSPSSPSPTTLFPAPTSSPSFAPTNTFSPTPKPKLPFPNITLQAMADPSSPQAQANRWLIGDPNYDDYSEERAFQRFALATLYYATDGKNWNWDKFNQRNQTATSKTTSNNFLSYTIHECQWIPLLSKEETCNPQDQYLNLLLPEMNLKGTLPPEIPLLLSPNTLQVIELSSNAISGNVPEQFCGNHDSTIPVLQTLDLSLNRLYGKIPSQIGGCAQLTALRLHWNPLLSNSLPTTLGRLSRLEELSLFATTLTGKIPSELGMLTSLKFLNLHDNFLSGTIPPQLFQPPSIRDSAIITSRQGGNSNSNNNNQMVVSNNIVKLQRMQLEQVRLDSNLLIGPIPSEIGSVAYTLRELHLSDNYMNATLPTVLGSLALLSRFEASQNRFTGPVPSELGQLGQHLTALDLHGNRLASKIPSELTLLTILEHLDLSDNRLTGPLPQLPVDNTAPLSHTTAWPRLRELELQQNQLTGPMELSGLIPQARPRLTLLDLGYNRFQGTIPSALGDLIVLTTLRLNHQLGALIGDVPTQLMELSKLVELDLSDNPDLSGSIVPVVEVDEGGLQLELLRNLRRLNIYNTSLTGTFPDSVCHLDVLSFSCSDELCGCNCLCPGETAPPTSNLILPSASPSLTPSMIAPTIYPTLSPSTSPTVGQTSLTPTEVPSKAPSYVPSISPSTSSGILTASPTPPPTVTSDLPSAKPTAMDLLSNLPQYTLEALQRPNSPQSQALRWLEADPAYTEYAFNRKLQRFVLATFLYSTSLPNQRWQRDTGWLSYDTDECDWFSDSFVLQEMDLDGPCTEGGEHYTILALRRNGLRGTIPAELELLTELTVIDLSENLLIGTLPSQIGGISKLEELKLGQNFLRSTLPSEIGSLSFLKTLFAWGNQFVSPLPSSIGQLAELRSLGLSSNQLTGSIPISVGLLTNLERLWLYQNFLSGQLPDQLGLLSNLETMDVSMNMLSGTIPTTMMQINRLRSMDLSNNQLTGELPSSIGLLSNSLVQLDVSDNGLSGTIPETLWQLTLLLNLNVARNGLNGPLGTEVGMLKRLSRLEASRNNLSGTIPDTISECRNLLILDISQNVSTKIV